jgi:RNA polymerase sigma-70 factor (ECF subfamily)
MDAQVNARASAARPNELSVARRAAVGDRKAFEWIARRHYQRLFRLARAALNDDLDAEDALQDAYLSAYQSLVQFRGDASLSTWLSRILLNECTAHWRRECRRQSLAHMISVESETAMVNVIPDPGALPDDSLWRAQTHAILARKIGGLPAALRTVFVMRSVRELSVARTARSLGITEGAVRARHSRARKLLREHLAQLIESTPARQLRIQKSGSSPTAGCEGAGSHPHQVTNAQQAYRIQADR